MTTTGGKMPTKGHMTDNRTRAERLAVILDRYADLEDYLLPEAIEDIEWIFLNVAPEADAAECPDCGHPWAAHHKAGEPDTNRTNCVWPVTGCYANTGALIPCGCKEVRPPRTSTKREVVPMSHPLTIGDLAQWVEQFATRLEISGEDYVAKCARAAIQGTTP